MQTRNILTSLIVCKLILTDDTNKKMLGHMKYVMTGLVLTDFLSLNPEVYSLYYQALDQEIENKKHENGLVRWWLQSKSHMMIICTRHARMRN